MKVILNSFLINLSLMIETILYKERFLASLSNIYAK